MFKNVNENFYTSIRNGGGIIRCGVSNHYFDRKDERYWGFSFNEFVSLIENSITYNPMYDELPQNLSNECIKSVKDKNEKYGKEHCFKLIHSEDLVIVMNKTEWNSYRDGYFKPQGYWFNEWVVVSMWRCNKEGILYTETQPKNPIKVNGRIIGWY